MPARRTITSGFTILEIMIAVAILTIGLMGILALFPVAIETSRVTIQDTNGVLIAQSVEQAIREGLAHRKGQDDSGRWTYFLFQHDGVKDPIPRRIQDANPNHDYYVLLPDLDPDRAGQTTRVNAFRTAKAFVYPETDGHEWTTADGTTESDLDDSGSPNGGGDPTKADDDGDDRELDVVAIVGDDGEGEQQETSFEVYRTFPLGRAALTEEELDSPDLLDSDRTDPLATYSYAFAIKRAFDDANKLASSEGPRSSFAPQGELYQVNIMIFRSFRKGTTNADPIYETNILVHK